MTSRAALRSALVLLVAAIIAAPGPARAQESFFDDYARTIVALGGRKWVGDRVPWPEPADRPGGDLYVLRSALRPLAVHAARTVAIEDAEAALDALEASWDLFDATGWPAPPADGGFGGTAEFDVYLVPSDEAAAARMDAPIPWSFLDAASTFAVVDASIDRDDLAPCVTSAYTQAVLLGQDPAEAPAWRRATGSWMAWMITGALGCGDPMPAQQREPWRSWIDGAAEEGAGGALFLAMVSARHDRGTGTFVRDVWQLARQQTWEGDELRASPDLWEALEAAVEQSGQTFLSLIEDLAFQRFFAGDPARARHATIPVLAELPGDAAVPVLPRMQWARLPQRTPELPAGIEPFGSGYALVDVSGAPESASVRIWLQGEYGVRWSLAAARLGADLRPLDRVTAPPRHVPNSYIPMQLTRDTRYVLIVVTNLSSRLPDADVPDENVRSFRVLVDRGE